MTVFVINQPKDIIDNETEAVVRSAYDITPASQHGEFRFIFPNGFRAPSSCPDDAVEHATSVLADYDPDSDFILWAGGDPIASVIVAGILADMTDGRISFLKWDKYVRTGGGYVPVELNLFAAMETINDE